MLVISKPPRWLQKRDIQAYQSWCEIGVNNSMRMAQADRNNRFRYARCGVLSISSPTMFQMLSAIILYTLCVDATSIPTTSPTTSQPTLSPLTSSPTDIPTLSPSKSPTTSQPTVSPLTSSPTDIPTLSPSNSPTTSPTTSQPTVSPLTSSPTMIPTISPSSTPTLSPTAHPSHFPTSSLPSSAPTHSMPTESPTTSLPSHVPSISPSLSPSLSPSSSVPTLSPTNSQPTASPSSSMPTESPSSSQPTISPTPVGCDPLSFPSNGFTNGSCGIVGGSNASSGDSCTFQCSPGFGLSDIDSATLFCDGPFWVPGAAPNCELCAPGSSSGGGIVTCTDCIASSEASGGTFTSAFEANSCTECTSCAAEGLGVLRNCTGDADRICYSEPRIYLSTAEFTNSSNVAQPFSVEIEISAPSLNLSDGPITIEVRLPEHMGSSLFVPNGISGWLDATSLVYGPNINDSASFSVNAVNASTIHVNVFDIQRNDPNIEDSLANLIRVSIVTSSINTTAAPVIHALHAQLIFGAGVVSETVSAYLQLTSPKMIMTKHLEFTATAVDAGDVFAHSYSISHSGSSSGPAYDILLTVTHDLYMIVDPLLVNCSGDCNAVAVTVWNDDLSSLTVEISKLGQSESVSILWSSRVRSSVPAGVQLLLDTDATVSYSSVDEVNATASAALMDSVSVGADSNLLGSVPEPNLTFVLSNTSIPESNEDVAVHEQIEFDLLITLPEGVNNISIDVGLPSVESQAAVTDVSVSSTHSGISLLNSELQSPVEPKSIVLGIDTLDIMFGVVKNVADGVSNNGDTIGLRISCYVADVPGITDGEVLSFSASVRYGDGTFSTSALQVSVAIEVPIVTMSASPLDGSNLDVEAGNNVSIHLSLQAHSATAFDIIIVQRLTAPFQVYPLSTNCIVGCSVSWSVDINASMFQVNIPVLLNGQIIQIEWVLKAGPAELVHLFTETELNIVGHYDTSPLDSGYSGRSIALAVAEISAITHVPNVAMRRGNSSMPDTSDFEVTPDEEFFIDIDVNFPRGSADIRLEVESSTSLSPRDMKLVPLGSGISMDPLLPVVLTDQIFELATVNVTKQESSFDNLSWNFSASLTYAPGSSYVQPVVTVRLYVANSLVSQDLLQYTVVEPLLNLEIDPVPSSNDADDNITYSFVIRHTEASAIAANWLTVSYRVHPYLHPIPGSFSACVLPFPSSESPETIAADCLALGGVGISADEEDYYNGNFSISTPRLELDTGLFVMLRATTSQEIVSTVPVISTIKATWRSGPDVSISRFTDEIDHTTSFRYPTLAGVAIVSSNDGSTSSNTVAIGEAVNYSLSVRLPEGNGAYLLLVDSSADVDITAVHSITFGASIINFSAPEIDANGQPVEVDLGFLSNIADNIDNEDDVLSLTMSLHVLDNGAGGPERDETIMMVAQLYVNDTIAATGGIPLVVDDPLMNLDLIQIGSSDPDIAGAECSGYLNEVTPVSSLEVIPFRVQLRQRPQSAMNAYEVRATCSFPIGLSVIEDSFLASDTNHAEPYFLNLTTNYFEAVWSSWPSRVTGTFVFQVRVDANPEMSSDIDVQCGVTWQSVPKYTMLPGREYSQSSLSHPWSTITCSVPVADPTLSTAFVIDGSLSMLGQDALAPLPVRVHQPLQIRSTVHLPEAEGVIQLLYSTDAEKTMLASSGTIIHVGNQLNGSLYLNGSNFGVNRNSLINFGDIVNYADFASNTDDKLITDVLGYVANNDTVLDGVLYSFYIQLRANDFVTSNRLYILVAEPNITISVEESTPDAGALEAGDTITCVVSINVLTESTAYDLLIIGTSSKDFGDVTSATNADSINTSMAIWSIASASMGVPVVKTYVLTLSEDVRLNHDEIRCSVCISFDGYPESSDFGSGRLQNYSAESDPKSVDVPSLHTNPGPYEPYNSTVSQTSDASRLVTIGEAFTTALHIAIPKGIVSGLTIEISSKSNPMLVSIGTVHAIVHESITCDSMLSSYSGARTAVMSFGNCHRVGGVDSVGIDVFLTNTTVLDAVENIAETQLDFESVVTFSNVTGNESSIQNFDVTVSEPYLDLVATSTNYDVRSMDEITISTTLYHESNSTSAAFDIWISSALADTLEILTVDSTSTTAVWESANQTWYLPVFDVSDENVTFTTTARVRPEAILGSTITNPNFELEYTTIPSVNGLGRISSRATSVPEFVVSSLASLSWRTSSTSDAYTSESNLGIGETVSLLGEISLNAASVINLKFSATEIASGNTVPDLTSVTLSPGTSCQNSVPIVTFIDANESMYFDFGMCTNSMPDDYAIVLHINLDIVNVPANVLGKQIDANATLVYFIDNETASFDSASQYFAIIEPELSLTSIVPVQHLFLSTTAVPFSIEIYVAPTFGHDVTMTIEMSQALELDAPSVTNQGSATIISSSTNVDTTTRLELNFGSISTHDTIQLLLHAQFLPSTPIMSELQATVSIYAASSDDPLAARLSHLRNRTTDTVEVWYHNTTVAISNTTLLDTTYPQIAVGEGFTISATVCLRGNSSVDIDVSVPVTSEGNPIAVPIQGPVVRDQGGNVGIFSAAVRSPDSSIPFTATSVVSTTWASVQNRNTSGLLIPSEDCFSYDIEFEVVSEASAGIVGTISFKTDFAESTASHEFAVTVVEPSTTTTVALVTPEPESMVEIDSNVTLEILVETGASPFHSAAYDVAVAVPLGQLDIRTVNVLGQDCEGILDTDNVDSYIMYYIDAIQPASVCKFTVTGLISSELYPAEILYHNISTVCRSIPTSVNSSNARTYGQDFAISSTYSAYDITADLQVEGHTLSDSVANLKHVPIGSILSLVSILQVPHVHVRSLITSATFPVSLGNVKNISIVECNESNLEVDWTSAAVFSIDNFLRPNLCNISATVEATVVDIPATVAGSTISVSAETTYPFSSKLVNTMVTVVEPVMFISVGINSSAGDAGDIFMCQSMIQHSSSDVGGSGSSAHNVSVEFSFSDILLSYNLSTHASLNVNGIPAALNCSVVTDTPKVSCILPILGVDDVATLTLFLQLAQSAGFVEEFDIETILRYTSSSTSAGRLYSASDRTSATTTGMYSNVTLANRTGIEVMFPQRSNSAFAVIGERLSIIFAVVLPEGHASTMNMSVRSPVSTLSHEQCELLVGSRVTYDGLADIECGVAVSNLITSAYDLSTVNNHWDNMRTVDDVIEASISFTILDTPVNNAGSEIIIEFDVETESDGNHPKYYIDILEPQLDVLLQHEVINRDNDSIVFEVTDLDRTHSTRAIFDLDMVHNDSATGAPAHDIVWSIGWNGSIVNFSVAVLNGSIVEYTSSNPDSYHLYSHSIPTFDLDDSLSRTIQIQIDDLESNPGDELCITFDYSYNSMPSGSLNSRTYIKLAASCYVVPFGQSSDSSGSLFEAGEIAGSVVGLVALVVLVVLFVVARRKQKEDDPVGTSEEVEPLKNVDEGQSRRIKEERRKQKAQEKLSENAKLALKQKFKEQRIAVAASNFSKAFAFGRFRYGKDAILDQKVLVKVFDLMMLSVRPNKGAVPGLIKECKSFLATEVSQEDAKDDVYMDVITDYIFDVAPYLMLEACIDAYAKIHDDIIQFDRARASIPVLKSDNIDNQEDMYQEPVVGEDQYEIPSTLLYPDSINIDEEEPDYAEIDDDIIAPEESDYMQPSEFKDTDPEYEELLGKLDGATYAEAAQLVPEDIVFPDFTSSEEEDDDELTYNTHFGEDTYANNDRLTTRRKPKKSVVPLAPSAIDSDDEDVYDNRGTEIRNNRFTIWSNGEDANVYGMGDDDNDCYTMITADDEDKSNAGSSHNLEITLDIDAVYGLQSESDGSPMPTTASKFDKRRESDRSDTYANSTTLRRDGVRKSLAALRKLENDYGSNDDTYSNDQEEPTYGIEAPSEVYTMASGPYIQDGKPDAPSQSTNIEVLRKQLAASLDHLDPYTIAEFDAVDGEEYQDLLHLLDEGDGNVIYVEDPHEQEAVSPSLADQLYETGRSKTYAQVRRSALNSRAPSDEGVLPQETSSIRLPRISRPAQPLPPEVSAADLPPPPPELMDAEDVPPPPPPADYDANVL